MIFIFQNWLSELTWKEQTVLILGLRSADTGGSKDVKLMMRWLRSIILKNAAPDKTFMKDTNFKSVIDIADYNPLAFDMLLM